MSRNKDRSKRKMPETHTSIRGYAGSSLCHPPPMHDDVARRLQTLVKELNAPVEVRQISVTKGKGAFVTSKKPSGTILWTETPVVAPLQHLDNRHIAYATCAKCCRWLGSISELAAVVVENAKATASDGDKSKDYGCRPPLTASLLASEQIVHCSEGCGLVYCSTRCRDNDWAGQHRLLCTGCGGMEPEELSEGQQLHRGALLMFEQHASKASESLLLAAKVIAVILSSWEQGGRSEDALADAKAAFGIFHNPLWWDVAATRLCTAKEAAEERAQMEDELRKSIRFLGLALLPCHRGQTDELFTLDFYSRIIGMFECNNISVEVECPLLELLSGRRPEAEKELSALDPSLRKDIQALASTLEKHCFKGTGLFALISTLNHSCEPNCAIEYDSEAIARVCSLRELAEGEELCISYIDTDVDLEARRSQLCGYGFTCDCRRCLMEQPSTNT